MMMLVFGWWDWNAEATSLDNRVTGERVVYRGPADLGDPSSSRFWLRFDYVHPELTFPILVNETTEAWGVTETKTVWMLDYEKSVSLWLRKSGSSLEHPGYGVWRRVDDCLTDALTCWPRMPEMQFSFHQALRVRGGWLNGQWNTDSLRYYRRIPDDEAPQVNEDEIDPWLIPLDEPAPSPWMFHPFSTQSSGIGDTELAPRVLIDGFEIDHQNSQRRLRLPAASDFRCLEGKTPYLISQDGLRVLYPWEGDTGQWQNNPHSPPKFRVLYADDEIVCDLFARSHHERDNSALWSFSCLPSGFGFRLPESHAATGRLAGAFSRRPSRYLCLRLQWALFDGWAHWNGTSAKSSAWVEGLHLKAAYTVSVTGGYRGGVLIGHIGSSVEATPFSL